MPFLKKSKSSQKKLRKEAGHWLRLGHKVQAYRCDVMAAGDLEKLRRAMAELEEALKAEEMEEAVAGSITRLKKILSKCGGCYYPHSHWVENVEMFLVAAILAIGIRTYFIQPFKIPTNSMYPTYNGLNYKLYDVENSEPEEPPGIANRIFRKLVLGASYKEIVAPVDGELRIALPSFRSSREAMGHNSNFSYQMVGGRKWLLFPTTLKEFKFYIGNQPVTVRVPPDFVFDRVVQELFAKTFNNPVTDPNLGRVLNTGLHFKKGERVLSFEILTGDALFVDRISYHFFPPKIGDPFVFRTDNIVGISQSNRGKYYIKRLVGQGGDTLSVRNSVLYRNGNPIEGAGAFEKNANREGDYEGYSNRWRLDTGLEDTIPEHHYYAMGDNSDQSSDSRAWGYVPKREVVGKAIFIYYPFTRRFGPAR